MSLAARHAIRAGAAAAALLFGLTACQGGDRSAELVARQAALDPPQLWLVQALGKGGAVTRSIYICADSNIRDGFTRARAEVNGKPCRDTTSPRVRPNGWVLRCAADGRPFGVSAVTVGDLQQDFTLDFALTQLVYFPRKDDPPPQSVRQVRRFRRVGACPVGWRIGDQARPGRRPHSAT